MAGGAPEAALAVVAALGLLFAGCGGRCTAGHGDHGTGGDRRSQKLCAVQQQILSKLSLRDRPKPREAASPLPRELALEALRRVHLLPEPRALEDQGAPSPTAEDDYYGRTAEIIAFAEPVAYLDFLYEALTIDCGTRLSAQGPFGMQNL
ncbi:hypothetical protein HPB47_000120 [Ixodes persulcatus]|uniref:Uncharacterized protein n=1 Tax=Ixodes persulcatus TaxID=34615 RepID=A0AC60PUF5_IXOPE|nr:hypothetical protein HPB47_000120 [Ixodes persulcatus]